MALTAKMKAFAQAVVDGLSNKDAAISAGYSEKTAMQQGAKLAKNPEIIAYIEKLTSAKKLTPKSKKLTPQNEQLNSEKPKQSIGQTKIAFRIFKIYRVYFMWHSR